MSDAIKEQEIDRDTRPLLTEAAMTLIDQEFTEGTQHHLSMPKLIDMIASEYAVLIANTERDPLDMYYSIENSFALLAFRDGLRSIKHVKSTPVANEAETLQQINRLCLAMMRSLDPYIKGFSTSEAGKSAHKRYSDSFESQMRNDLVSAFKISLTDDALTNALSDLSEMPLDENIIRLLKLAYDAPGEKNNRPDTVARETDWQINLLDLLLTPSRLLIEDSFNRTFCGTSDCNYQLELFETSAQEHALLVNEVQGRARKVEKEMHDSYSEHLLQAVTSGLLGELQPSTEGR